MRNEQHYRDQVANNPSATFGFTFAAAAVYAARYGYCEAEQHGTDEYRAIARRIKLLYGETLDGEQLSNEMDTANRSAAASVLGKMTSSKKAQASRRNASSPPKPGKRPRGRPKKS